MTEFVVVDCVERETGELLRETGATLAFDDDQVYVLERKE
jgi:hypothetical protein